MVVGTGGTQQVEQILGIAQICEIRPGDDEDLVSPNKRTSGPAGPLMRHVEHRAGHGRAQGVIDGIEGLAAEVVCTIERRGGSKQAQLIGALREQAVNEGSIDPVGREYRIGDSLRRILIESSPAVPKARSRSPTTVSNFRSRAIDQATLWAIVDAPTPPLAPITAMILPTGLASGAENNPQIARTTSNALTGDIR